MFEYYTKKNPPVTAVVELRFLHVNTDVQIGFYASRFARKKKRRPFGEFSSMIFDRRRVKYTYK